MTTLYKKIALAKEGNNYWTKNAERCEAVGNYRGASIAKGYAIQHRNSAAGYRAELKEANQC